jgi:hypothetical protein
MSSISNITLSLAPNMPQSQTSHIREQHPMSFLERLRKEERFVVVPPGDSKNNMMMAYYGSPTSVLDEILYLPSSSGYEEPTNRTPTESREMTHSISATSTTRSSLTSEESSQHSFLPVMVDKPHSNVANDIDVDSDSSGFGFYVDTEDSFDPPLVLREDVAPDQYTIPPGHDYSQIISRTERVRKRQANPSTHPDQPTGPPRGRFRILHMLQTTYSGYRVVPLVTRGLIVQV